MTSHKIPVDIAQLQAAFTRALNEIASAYGSKILVDDVMYWAVDTSDLFRTEEKPKDFTLGSISEDKSDIEGVLEEDGYLGFPGIAHLRGLLDGLVWTILHDSGASDMSADSEQTPSS